MLEEIIKQPRLRKEMARQSLPFFGSYYMSHYMTHAPAPFHALIDEAIKEPEPGDPTSSLIIGFRESAKTAKVRFRLLHAICFGTRRNAHWVCDELNAAKKNVFAVARELQTNKRLIRDFGHLYFGDHSRSSASKRKQIGSFITENGVSVNAGSTKVSVRGNLDQENRPDFLVLDDIENLKTVRSAAHTRATIEYITEALAGQAPGAQTILLANRISRQGVVAHMEKIAEVGDWNILDIPIMERGADESNWPSRIVMTRDEEARINRELPRRQHVKSIEGIKRKIGSAAFEAEMMNNPSGVSGGVVKREWIKYFDTNRLHRNDHGQFFFLFEGDSEMTPLTIYGAIDPAVSTKATSDDRSICWLGVANRKIKTGDIEEKVTKYLVLACVAGKWTLTDFTQKIAKGRDFFRPQRIGVESNGVQQVFRHLFQQAGISTEALNPDGDKLRRMNANVADIEFGDIMFADDGSCNDLVDELVMFTGESGGIDNRVDAFNYAVQMAKKTGGFVFVNV